MKEDWVSVLLSAAAAVGSSSNEQDTDSLPSLLSTAFLPSSDRVHGRSAIPATSYLFRCERIPRPFSPRAALAGQPVEHRHMSVSLPLVRRALHQRDGWQRGEKRGF